MRGLGRVAAREHVCRSADRSTDPEHPRSLPREEFVAYSSLGTDLALQFARSVFCARVPVTEDMLVEIKLNQPRAAPLLYLRGWCISRTEGRVCALVADSSAQGTHA